MQNDNYYAQLDDLRAVFWYTGPEEMDATLRLLKACRKRVGDNIDLFMWALFIAASTGGSIETAALLALEFAEIEL
jgi:hypothetical protein